MIDATEFGKFISGARKEKGLTQAYIAGELNVTVQAVSKWECGKGLPDINLLIPLSEILGVNISELLAGRRIEKEETKDLTQNAVAEVVEISEKQKRAEYKEPLIILLIAIIWNLLYPEIFNAHIFPHIGANMLKYLLPIYTVWIGNVIIAAASLFIFFRKRKEGVKNILFTAVTVMLLVFDVFSIVNQIEYRRKVAEYTEKARIAEEFQRSVDEATREYVERTYKDGE